MPGFHIHGHREDAVPQFSCRYDPATYRFSVRVQWEKHGSEYTGLEVEDIRSLANVLAIALTDHSAGPPAPGPFAGENVPIPFDADEDDAEE